MMAKQSKRRGTLQGMVRAFLPQTQSNSSARYRRMGDFSFVQSLSTDRPLTGPLVSAAYRPFERRSLVHVNGLHWRRKAHHQQPKHNKGAFAVRIIAACTLALLLAGCTTSPPKASDQERNEVMPALNACLDAAARKLDDGKSEASTIALGLRPSCTAEFARSREVYARSLNPMASQMYHRMDEEAFMQVATAAVLNERAKRRQ